MFGIKGFFAGESHTRFFFISSTSWTFNILSFHFISNILFISPSCLQSSLFYSLFFCSFKNLPFICFSLNIFTTFSLFKFRINSVLYFPPTLLCDSLIMLFLFPLSFPPSLVLYGSSSQTWIFLNNTLIWT